MIESRSSYDDSFSRKCFTLRHEYPRDSVEYPFRHEEKQMHFLSSCVDA